MFADLLSYNIKRLRRAKKMSQMELSIRSNLSLSFINSIENKQKWVSAKTLAKIAEALKAKPHELFLPKDYVEGDSLRIAEERRQILDELRDVLANYE